MIDGLSCQECVTYAREYIKTNPPQLANSTKYQQWMFDFHNWVNIREGVPVITWDEYEDRYKGEITAASYQK